MSVYEQVVTTKISQHSTCPREVACYIVNTQGEAGFLRFCTCCAIEVQASQHQPQSSRGYMPLQLATTGVDHIRWLCNHIRCQHQGWQACCGFAHVSQVKQPASQHQPPSSRGYMLLQLATTGVDHNIDARWLCNYIRCQHQGWQDCCGFAHVSQVKQPASLHQPQSSRQLACPAVM